MRIVTQKEKAIIFLYFINLFNFSFDSFYSVEFQGLWFFSNSR